MTWLRARWWIWRHPFKSAAILRHLGDAEILEGAQKGADTLPDHDKRDDGGEGK